MIKYDDKRFSVIIGAQGDYFEVLKTCLDSLLKGAIQPENFDIIVCGNRLGNKSNDYLMSLYKEKKIDRIILSNQNLNKDPMLRSAKEIIGTDFILWLDDDTQSEMGWDLEVNKIIRENPNLNVAGNIYKDAGNRRKKPYQRFLKKRPWYLGRNSEFQLNFERMPFPVGWCLLMRRSLLDLLDFPDRDMHYKDDDVFLAEICRQYDIRIHDFQKISYLHEKIKSQPIHYRGNRGVAEF